MIGYRWTRPAIAVLCEMYPSQGWRPVAERLGIDKSQVQRKAKAIRLRTTYQPPRGKPFAKGSDARRFNQTNEWEMK
jgi:hypothetical protein